MLTPTPESQTTTPGVPTTPGVSPLQDLRIYIYLILIIGGGLFLSMTYTFILAMIAAKDIPIIFAMVASSLIGFLSGLFIQSPLHNGESKNNA